MPVFSTWCTVLDVVLVYTTCGWGKPFNSKHCWETLAAEPTCVLSYYLILGQVSPSSEATIGITKEEESNNKRFRRRRPQQMAPHITR